MKNFITSFFTASAFVLLTSFDSPEEKKITISVTAGTEASFDLYFNGKTIHNVKTPYLFSTPEKGRLIFKSLDETSLTVEAKDDDRSMVKSQWKTIVVTIDNGKLETFGMD